MHSHSLSHASQPPNESSSSLPTPPPNHRSLRELVKAYGRPAVVVYFSVGTIILSGCFLVVKTGVDVEGLLKIFGLETSPHAGNLIIAYALSKVRAATADSYMHMGERM